MPSDRHSGPVAGPFSRLWLYAPSAARVTRGDQNLQAKATEERSSRPGDACDPPGPPLLGAQPRQLELSMGCARDAVCTRRAVESRQRNRTQLSVDHITPVRNFVSVGSAFTEIEQLSDK